MEFQFANASTLGVLVSPQTQDFEMVHIGQNTALIVDYFWVLLGVELEDTRIFGIVGPLEKIVDVSLHYRRVRRCSFTLLEGILVHE